MEADVKIAMRERARTTILAADSSKMGNVFFVKVMDLKEGDILVTDKLPQKEWANYLEQQGVQLVTGN